MAVIHEPIPSKHTPWENYGGQEVENYIKEQLDLKAGYFFFDETNNRYLVFADEENKGLYVSDPEEYSSLLIATFDAPFNYSASIEVEEPAEAINYIALGSTGNYIRANFDIVDKTGASVGDNYNVTVTFRNGSATQKVIRTVAYGTQFVMNIDSYLTEGANIVTLAIVGQDTLAATTVGLTFNVINLQLSDNYDISQVYDPDGQLRISYTISGSGIKILEWYLDGELLGSIDSPDPEDIIQVPNTTRLKTIELSGHQLGNGRHNIQYRARVQAGEGTTFYSQTLFRDFIVNDGFLVSDVVATSFEFPSENDIIDAFTQPIPLYGATQYVAKRVRYAVLSPLNNTEISIALGNRTTTYAVEENAVYDYDIKSFSSGETAFSLTLGGTTLSFNAVIGASPYTDLEEITNGLIFAFAGNEKSNSSDSRDTWSYTNSAGTTFRGSLSGFRWTSRSGWTSDGLLMDAGTSFAVSNFKPFQSERRTNGFTIEFEFETRRVLDDDEVICDLRTNGVGLLVTASEASLTSRGGTVVSRKYKSGDSLRIGFVINGDNAGRKTHLMQVFIDGINSGTINYSASDSFISAASLAFAGTSDATILLKYIRAYERPLSDDEMMNNFILYRPTTDELIEAYDRNDILDENGQPSSDKIANSVPIIKITGDVDRLMNFTSKDTYLWVPKVEIINNADPTKNLTILNATLRCQGTSSMNYPIKNMRLYLQKDSADTTVPAYVTRVFDYQGNELTGKQRLYAFKDGARPVKVWCFKADYAESSSTHNTGIARLWNEVMKNAIIANVDPRHYLLEYFPDSHTPLRTLAQHYANAAADFNYDVRTTVDGFPCSIFYHKTEEAPLICLGKYNWNNDKSTEAVFGFCDVPGFDDLFADTMQCWETITGDLEINQFISVEHWNDTFVDEDGNDQPMWRQNFEARYPDDAGEDSEKTRADSYLYNLCSWIASTKGASKVQNGKMVVDNQTKMNKFKTEKWQHFDVYKTAGYYVYLMRFGAVDQPVKNSMLTSEDGLHFFYINYDNDTINALINSGLLKLLYDVNRQSPDPDDPTTFAYAGHDSVLWNNLEADDEFMEIVKVVDQALFLAGLTYTNTIDMFNNKQSAKWSERLHNYDYTFKYLDPYTDRGINNLEMLQGARRTHRQWWLSHRFALYDGMNQTGQFRGSYIQLRPNNSGDAISGDVAVVTPALDGQVFGWSIGNAQEAPHAVTGVKDTPITFDFNEAAIRWYIGGYIFFFNLVYAKAIDLSAISRVINRIDFTLANSDVFESELSEVILGTVSSSTNTHLSGDQVMNIQQLKYLRVFRMCNYKAVTTLDFSSNGFLEVLDLRGCNSALVGEQYTTGTTGVTLPVAAPLDTIYFPDTVQAVVMEDLLELDTFEIANNGPAVTLFDVKSCAVFSGSAAWLKTWLTGKSDEFLAGVTMNISGIDWNNTTVADLLLFAPVGSLRFKGKIVCADLTTLEQANALMEIFGPKCFESTNELWITASSDLQFFAGPDQVTEGNTAQYSFVVIGKGEGTVTYSLAGSTTGVSIQSETGLLTTTLAGRNDFTVTLNAIFTEEESGTQTFGTKVVTIKKETYPSASDIVISGPSQLTEVETQYSAAITSTSYTGQVSHRWRLVATEPDSATDITDFFEIWSAPSDEMVCTIRRIDNTYMIAEGSLVFELVNRLGTVVTSKSYTIAAVSQNIAVSKAANAPIMAALYAAYGPGGTQVSRWTSRGLQPLSSDKYVSKVEALNFTGEDLNPAGSATGSIFYAQRLSITNFDEFQWFTGVTSIPAYCFCYVNSIASMTFPPHITSVGNFAFATNSSYNKASYVSAKLPIDIVLDEATSIGNNAFSGSAIKSFSGSSIAGIYNAANNTGPFNRCSNLRSIRMESITFWGQYTQLDSCSSLEEIYVPHLTSGGYWFYSGNMTAKNRNIVITVGSVTGAFNIGNWTIHLSKYATNFNPNFNSSSQIRWGKKIEIDPENTVYRTNSQGQYVVNISNQQIVYIVGSPEDGDVIIDSDVNSIGTQAAACGNGDNHNITSISFQLPSSCTSIGQSAFLNNKKITSIEIPSSVTSFGSAPFGGCTGIKNISLDCTCDVATNTFANCTSLQTLHIGAHFTANTTNLAQALNHAGHNTITSITVDSGNPVYTASGNCLIANGTEVRLGCNTSVIPNTVTRFGNYSFAYCKQITSLDFIPSNVTGLGNYAFNACTGLTGELNTKSIITIGQYTFNGCTGITSVVAPNVTTVEAHAFDGLKDIVSINFPSVVSFGNQAFFYNQGATTNLKTIIIGDAITSIGAQCFYRNGNVETIIIKRTTAPSIVNGSGWGLTTNCTGYQFRTTGNNTLYIPENATGYTGYGWTDLLSADYGGFHIVYDPEL